MRDADCVEFLQWALPKLRMRWPGFRKVRNQVCKRIKQRIRELSLDGFADYRRYLTDHHAEWRTLDGYCRITISTFWRDRGVFSKVSFNVLPHVAARAARRGDKTLRCWSAGCASGEEPYSLTIAWRQSGMGKEEGVRLSVLATDADPHMIERAKRACYGESSLRYFPEEWRDAAFEEREGEFCLKETYRSTVHLDVQDIRDSMPDGPFDLILCRNLAFTYFDEALQKEVLKELSRRLSQDGVLVIGKHERLPAHVLPLEPVGEHEGLYIKRGVVKSA